MAKSDNLRKAKAARNDNFFTRIEDIIAEVAQHKDYVKQFEGKVVLCNCDDPEWSAFVEFFRKFFHKLKLKKMISTHYNEDGSPSYMLEWSGEKINGDTVNMIKKPLKGNGDFRSEECIELLKEADIIVTNEPFSLFRQYTNILYEYNKQFVIIGSMNAIAYKEFFPRLRDGEAFIGYTNPKEFKQPDGTIKKFGNICWYTNLDLDKSHDPLILTKNYKGNEEKYPKYDNYDAIECNKVANIPKDYFPCWYDCPHVGECEYAKTEGRGEALCESHAEDTSACRSRTCHHTAESSSELSDSCQVVEALSAEMTDAQSSTSKERASMPASSFSGRRKCNGIIGVPITYMSQHNIDQFNIVGASVYDDTPCRIDKKYKELGYRFLKKDGITESGSGALRDKKSPKVIAKGTGDFSISPEGTVLSAVYVRIFIRRRKEK